MPKSVALLLGHLGHRRHGHVLNSCHRRSRRSGRRARLLRLDAEESVEESDAEFPSAREIHEKVDGVVGVVKKGDQGVEEPSCSALFRSDVRKCSVGVSEEVDVNRDAEHEEQDADDNQHHCR